MNAVKMANTRNGWAIAIMKTANRKKAGAEIFSVVRVSPKNQYVTLTDHNNEAAARKSANHYWAQDVAA